MYTPGSYMQFYVNTKAENNQANHRSHPIVV